MVYVINCLLCPDEVTFIQMPRRRPSQRAKPHSKPRPVDRKDGRLKRWNALEDIELDEEDQCASRPEPLFLFFFCCLADMGIRRGW